VGSSFPGITQHLPQRGETVNYAQGCNLSLSLFFFEKQMKPTIKVLQRNVILYNFCASRTQNIQVNIDAKVTELIYASIYLFRKHDFGIEDVL
jgi:hypothetical protein